jgi:hypothetical protein
MAAIDSGASTPNKANVNANFQLEVHTPTTQVQAGFVCLSSEIDAGVAIGSRTVLAPATDANLRLRGSVDHLLDNELFNYGSQNTGKHFFSFTTLTCTAGSNGLLVNSGNILTASTGCTFGTFAMFGYDYDKPMLVEQAVSFSAQPVSNVTFDVGVFQRGASTAFAPLDGVYFRVTSAGVFGVVNNNGVETTSAVFPATNGTGTFAYINNTVYRFQVLISNTSTQFFINDVLYATIANPSGTSRPFRSMALPWSCRMGIAAGGAGGAFQASIWEYTVAFMGPLVAENLGAIGNRVLGAHQGLSGGTIGSLAAYSNNTAATAGSVPTNTTVILSGLGGQIQETFTGAINTDLIISSYQVPAGSTTIQGRRLRIHGVRIDAFVSTVLAGGPVNAIWTLNFGHTAASLATAESSSFINNTAKAPRREVLGQQAIAAAAAVGTSLGAIDIKFTEPIYVNPGEFIAVAKKYYGTVGTSGTIQNLILFDYGWE